MDIQIRKGNLQDTEGYIRLLAEIKAGMNNQDWFFLDPPEEIRAFMENGTMELWVAMDGERMAGGFDILHPGLKSINYGYDLGFSERQLLRVVQMDTAAVAADYRGLGLQKKLMETAEAEIRKESGRILLSTVHPDNVYSMNNLLKQGYTVAKTVAKYGSVRNVLRKDLP